MGLVLGHHVGGGVEGGARGGEGQDLYEAKTAEIAAVDVPSNPPALETVSVLIMSSKILSFQMQASASLAIFAMVLTQMTGKSPLAVSPDSITQSDPSMTALATSLASALVGLDHGLQHLGGADDRLACPVALGNHGLLSNEDLLCGDLNTHVSSCNHQAFA